MSQNQETYSAQNDVKLSSSHFLLLVPELRNGIQMTSQTKII